MRLPRWLRRRSKVQEVSEDSDEIPERTLECKYCGPVKVRDPEEHLTSASHRQAQMEAL